jgi:hypothetical protein
MGTSSSLFKIQWNKRAFYSLLSNRLSTAAVFEFIERAGAFRGWRVRARGCTRRRYFDGSSKTGNRRSEPRAARKLFVRGWSRGGQPDDDRRVTSRAAGQLAESGYDDGANEQECDQTLRIAGEIPFKHGVRPFTMYDGSEPAKV